MTRKLTLSISEETVLKARRISRRRGKSISRMVEEYLNSVVEKEAISDPLVEIKQIMKKYKSKIPLPADGNYNKMVNEWRYQEYMKKSKKRK